MDCDDLSQLIPLRCCSDSLSGSISRTVCSPRIWARVPQQTYATKTWTFYVKLQAPLARVYALRHKRDWGRSSRWHKCEVLVSHPCSFNENRLSTWIASPLGLLKDFLVLRWLCLINGCDVVGRSVGWFSLPPSLHSFPLYFRTWRQRTFRFWEDSEVLWYHRMTSRITPQHPPSASSQSVKGYGRLITRWVFIINHNSFSVFVAVSGCEIISVDYCNDHRHAIYKWITPGGNLIS